MENEDDSIFITIEWPELLSVYNTLSAQVFASWAVKMDPYKVEAYLAPMGFSMQDIAGASKEITSIKQGQKTDYTYRTYQRMVFRVAFTAMFVLTDFGEQLLREAMAHMPTWRTTLGDLEFRQQFLQAHSAIMEVERTDAPNNRDMVAFFEKLDAYLKLEDMEKWG